MLIFVKTPDGRTIEIVAYSAELIGELENELRKSASLPADNWYLSFNGQRLDRQICFRTYDIGPGSTLCLELVPQTDCDDKQGAVEAPIKEASDTALSRGGQDPAASGSGKGVSCADGLVDAAAIHTAPLVQKQL
eukprot:CAMPEP_0179150638 /NCGR_PEP_ID=MMETSP0796-20121207/73074_1 /TAXON_ID=73915 /ORGANISM="Pyrodinium bahamense, Strain pbaha01" /LENGTH=134 /DNA_ID=CAMNT_0020851637 /DNA_START=9 /DNA_END=409 /DNA_ORIENTATION=-